jgi:hypothetical protein
MLNSALTPTPAATRFKSMDINVFNVNENNSGGVQPQDVIIKMVQDDPQSPNLGKVHLSAYSCDSNETQPKKKFKVFKVTFPNIPILKKHLDTWQKNLISLPKTTILDVLDACLKPAAEQESEIKYHPNLAEVIVRSERTRLIHAVYNRLVQGDKPARVTISEANARLFRLRPATV